MKKHLLLFIMTCFVIAAAISLNPKSAQADTMGSVANGTLTISGTGTMTDFANGTSAPWYSSASSITKIVINSGVTSIGDYAFANLKNVTSVSIPTTVTSIGKYSFYGCAKLTSVIIPSTVEDIDAGVFSGCTALTSCDYSCKETAIPVHAFKNCTSLKTFRIPNNITKICSWAFYGCTSLTSATFKSGTTYIGSQAYYGCTSLTNLYFVCNAPSDITSDCFTGVTATAYYIRETDNSTWTSSVRQNYGGTITWKPDYYYFTSSNLSATSYTYTGSACKPSVILVSGDYTHILGTDYTVAYSNNINAGTATATYTTKGIWGSNSINKTFTIAKADTTMTTSASSVSLYPGLSYTLTATPAKSDATFTYSYASSDTSVATVSSAGKITAVKAGSCTVTVTCSSNNYNDIVKKIPVTVNTPTNISGLTVSLSQTSYVYDGTAKKPTVTVKSSSTTYSSTYYDVSYTNNVNAGTATVTVTGKYLLTGTKTLTFTIAKASQSCYVTKPTDNKIAVGMTVDLKATGTMGTVTYSTSDTSLATITSAGVLTAKKAGTVFVYIKAAETTNYNAGNWTDTYTIVNPTDISTIAASAALSQTSYIYSGSACKPTVTLKSGSTTLTEGTDYTLTYANNVNAGTAKVTITGKNYYTGTATQTFTILQADQTLNASIGSYSLTKGQTTTISVPGKKTSAALTYTSSNTSVATVSTSGVVTAVNTGSATITVTAPQDTNYKSATATFSIEVKSSVTSITSGTMALGTTSYTYDGTEKQPAVTVTLSGKTLTNGTDYVVTYSNNIHAGTATATVSGKGNYAGTLTKTYTINKAAQTVNTNLSASTLTVGATATCNASANGTLTYASDNTTVATVDTYGVITAKAAGTAKITVSAAATSDYNAASKVLTITVKNNVTNISTCTVTLDQESFVYDGNAKTPAVTVKNGSTTLTKDTDYTVAYASNTNAGNATVTVTGKNDYTGSVEKTFTISKADQNLTATLDKSEIAIDETADITTANGVGNITFVSSDASVVSFTEKAATAAKVIGNKAGTVTITVTAAGNSNYNSDTVLLSLVVKKTVTDINNCTISLGKTSYTYNGDEHRPSVTVLDGSDVLTEGMDYTVLYQNFIDAGTATVTITGKNDYTGTVTREYTINKANQTISAIVGAETLNTGAKTDITVTAEGNISFASGNTAIATVEQTSKNTASVKGVKAGVVTVTITVEGDENYNGGTITKTFYVNPKQVTGLKAANAASGVQLTWTKLSGVTGYIIYRKTGTGSYAKIGTATTNSYVDKKAANGTTYSYKVRAYLKASGKTLAGPYSAAAADTWITRPAISSATNVATKSILVKWAKNSKATGYQIQYSTSSAFKSAKTVTVKGAASVSKKITGLTKGKYYYVRIRTYKAVSGKAQYSVYSAVKKVKVAK